MKKYFVLIIALLLSFTVMASGTVVIDDFSSASNYTTTNLRTGDTMALSSNGSALQVTFNATNSADPWYIDAAITRTFTTPFDISTAEFFSVDVKVPTANSNLYMVVSLIDESGASNRYVLYPCGTATGSSFLTYSFTFSDKEKEVWASHNAINMKRIKKISYHLGNGGTIAAGSSFVYTLANFKIYSGIKNVNETVIENFNSYATVQALTTAWLDKWTGARACVASLVDDGKGGKAAKFNATFAGVNANSGNILTSATPIDISGASYFRFRLIGDYAYASTAPVFNIFIGDTAGNFAQGMVYSWASVGGSWADIYFPFGPSGIDYPTDNTWAAFQNSQWGQIDDWREFRYWRDASGSLRTDLTAINRICIAVQGTAGTYPVSGSWTIDDLAVGFPMEPMPGVSLKSYNVKKVAVAPAIDGVANASEWDKAVSPGCTGFAQYDNATIAAQEEQTVKAVFDANNLYLLWQGVNNGFQLDFDPATSGQPYYNPAGTGYAGDDFEAFFAPGGNNANHYYHMIFFPCTTNNVCYISSEIEGWNAWTLSASTAAFSYNTVTKVITIEAKIPWTDFNSATSPVSGAPTDASQWGIQLAFANNTPAEFTDWNTITGASGFADGRPMGTWIFNSGLTVSPAAITILKGNSVAITASGVEPVRWSFSASSTVLTSSIGTLSASSGNSITFSSTSIGTGIIYVTDSNSPANSYQISVAVVPTSAPLWMELE